MQKRGNHSPAHVGKQSWNHRILIIHSMHACIQLPLLIGTTHVTGGTCGPLLLATSRGQPAPPPQPQLLLKTRLMPRMPGTYEYCVELCPLQSEVTVTML